MESMAFDVTKRQTFDHIPRWLEELSGDADKNIIIILTGNKNDLEDQRAVRCQRIRSKVRTVLLRDLCIGIHKCGGCFHHFMTVMTGIFDIVNKKTLVANEDHSNGNTASVAGKQILVAGPG